MYVHTTDPSRTKSIAISPLTAKVTLDKQTSGQIEEEGVQTVKYKSHCFIVMVRKICQKVG